MTAKPFVANLSVQYQDGFSENIMATGSDVNTQSWVGADGTSLIKLSAAHGNAVLKDIIISPAPEDCRYSTIRVNGKSIPDVVLHGANLHSTVVRQFQQCNLRLPAGAQLQFTQVT
mgnify:CR=1 FL=1